MQNLLQYVHEGTVTDPLTRDLEEAVKRANKSEVFKIGITYAGEIQEYEDAIQELQQELDIKDEEIENLKNRLTQLEDAIKDLPKIK